VLATPAIGLVLLLLLRAGQPHLLWLQNLAGFAGVLLFVVPPPAPLMQNQRQTPVRDLAILAGSVSKIHEDCWGSAMSATALCITANSP